MKIIKLPIFDIIVTIDNLKNGEITSSMHLNAKGERYKNSEKYHNAIDVIESLILAHACAGVDITTPAYIEGIKTTEQIIGNI